ncbi:MAG: glycoside hydrolase family 25 protein [Lachnospiraceae bacterium]|nr:glycoside hydrolase family 25 protein [Lachnospiraceae bacterium]
MDNNVRKKSRLGRYLALFIIIDLVLLTACIFLLMKNIYDKKVYEMKLEEEAGTEIHEITVDEEEIADELEKITTSSVSSDDDRVKKVKSLAERGSSALEMLKVLFPQQLVIADEGAFHFYDINRNLKKNTYDNNCFSVTDENRMIYTKDDEEIGYCGIDVSEHNGEIDWEEVAADGIDFVYIRAGYRGYGSGKMVEDKCFVQNIEGAKTAGLSIGIYYFTQAVNENEAVEEADFILEKADEYGVDIPIAIDVEKIDDPEAEVRTAALSKDEYTKNVRAFCKRVESRGYGSIIYGNAKTFMMLVNMSELEDKEKWFADYIGPNDIVPYFPYEFRIWQYISNGTCRGVEGNVDMNLAFY